MESLKIIKYVAACVGAAISTLLGGWDLALTILAGFVAVDYATGVVAAHRDKALDSRIGFMGIAKKVFLFVPVGIAFALDQLIGQDLLRNLTIFFYLANEGLSILENLGRIGVALPPGLGDALMQLKERK